MDFIFTIKPYLDEKGAVGDSDSYTELLSSVPSRDDVNIFDAGVRYGIFHHATGLQS